MEVVNFSQHKGLSVQGLHSAHLAVLLWHLDSDQETLRQNRCLWHVVPDENPIHPIHSSCDKCGGQMCHRLLQAGVYPKTSSLVILKIRWRRSSQSPGSCNEQPTHRMERPRGRPWETWLRFPEMFNSSTSGSTRLGIVLQIISSGMNWSTLLCCSRSMPSRRRRNLRWTDTCVLTIN